MKCFLFQVEQAEQDDAVLLHRIKLAQSAHDATTIPRMKLLWGRTLVKLQAILLDRLRQDISESQRVTYP